MCNLYLMYYALSSGGRSSGQCENVELPNLVGQLPGDEGPPAPPTRPVSGTAGDDRPGAATDFGTPSQYCESIDGTSSSSPFVWAPPPSPAPGVSALEVSVRAL